MSLAHLESENVVGELGCFRVVEDAEYKTRWHQASLDELLMEKSCGHFTSVFLTFNVISSYMAVGQVKKQYSKHCCTLEVD